MMNFWADMMQTISSLQHFHFLRPYWLLLLLPFVWFLKSLSQRDDTLAHWRKLMSPEILKHLTVQGNNNSPLSPRTSTWIMVVIITIILAGPSWTQQPSPLSEDQSALVIALDVSESMQQTDLQPSRLLRAKQKIIELLALRGDSNTALIAFSGSAHVVMPVTNDSEMIRHFLDALDTKIMPTQGKAPQSILPLAAELLRPSQVPGTVLLIGDGASQETQTAFQSFFQTHNHQLIIWGIGDATLTNNIDSDSTIIPIQTEQLATIASASNGRFLTLTHDKQDVIDVERYIQNNLTIVDDGSRPWYDAGYPLVFIIALVFLLWFRQGWTLQW